MVYRSTFDYSYPVDNSAHESLGCALAAVQTSAATGDELAAAARTAFVNGVVVASVVGAVASVVTAVIAMPLLRQPADTASTSTAVY